MDRDYQFIGLVDKATITGPLGLIAPTTQAPSGAITVSGFLVLRAITDCPVTACVSRFIRQGIGETAAFTLGAGQELFGIESVSVTSGVMQVLWFKS